MLERALPRIRWELQLIVYLDNALEIMLVLTLEFIIADMADENWSASSNYFMCQRQQDFAAYIQICLIRSICVFLCTFGTFLFEWRLRSTLRFEPISQLTLYNKFKRIREITDKGTAADCTECKFHLSVTFYKILQTSKEKGGATSHFFSFWNRGWAWITREISSSLSASLYVCIAPTLISVLCRNKWMVFLAIPLFSEVIVGNADFLPQR